MYAAETYLLRRISSTTKTSRLPLKHCPCWNAVTRFHKFTRQIKRLTNSKDFMPRSARAHTHTLHMHARMHTHTLHTHSHTHTLHTHTHTHTHIHTHTHNHTEKLLTNLLAVGLNHSFVYLVFLSKSPACGCRLMTLPSKRHQNLFE